MTRDDEPGRGILSRAREPGFTPGRRDIAPLLDLLLGADEDGEVRAAEGALARRADLALPAALTRLAASSGPGQVQARVRLLRLIGRVAGPADAGAAAIRDPGATAAHHDAPIVAAAALRDAATTATAAHHDAAIVAAAAIRDPGAAAAHHDAATAPAAALSDPGATVAHHDAAAAAAAALRDPGEAAAHHDAATAAAAALHDPDPRVRRQAALALARAAGSAAEEPLLAAWQTEPEVTVRRGLAQALGLAGGERGLAALRRALPGAADPELRRLVERAVLTASRTLERGRESTIDPNAAPPAPLPVLLRCRAGLERLLAAELDAAGWKPEAIASGRVETRLAGQLASLFHFRLHHGAGFPLPAQSGPVASAVVAALASPEAAAVFSAFTRGAVRFRIEWERGGHRRAEVWRIAGDIAARRPDLINDPTDSTWRVRVSEGGDSVLVALEPRKLDDPRFAYRVADVPAASHPTLAAALARLAVTHSLAPAEDVVWDPFAGSGLELCERGRLAPARRLVGTDVSAEAIAAARANLDAAGVSADLVVADALVHEVPDATVILTNPPMGKRVLRGRAQPVLEQLVERAAALPAGGLLCWISPIPGQTRARAAASGLRLLDAHTVDMGGFAAEIQVMRREPRPAPTRARAPRPRAGSRAGARRTRRARSE